MLNRPEEIADVDDLDLVRMTRDEVLERYGTLAIYWRRRVITEQVLTAEVLKDMFRRLLEMPEGVVRGRVVWEMLLPLVPRQPHGLDAMDVRIAALNVLCPPGEISEPPGAWWWRLRVLYDIPDPVAWVVEMAEKRERGWARRLAEMCWGEAGEEKSSLVAVYWLVRKCREELEYRKNRQKAEDGGAA